MSSKGFTLIELLVSVSIVLVVSGLLVTRYSGFSARQTVLQASVSLSSNLSAAQTKAASGEKPTGCDTLEGYAVTFTATTYAIRPQCLVGGVSSPVGQNAPFTLPSGVTFSPQPQNFLFLPLTRGVSIAQTITIVGSQDDQASIIITESGSVTTFVPTPTP